MILSEQQIYDLIKHPANSDAIKQAKDLQDVHKVHVTGKGYKAYIHQVIGYENAEQYAQKKELAEPVTPLLTKKIRDEHGRWKNAGAKKYYEWGNNADKNKEFVESILSQVWKGQSMDYFVKNFLDPALYTEFNGFILVERGKVEEVDGVYYEVRDGIVSVVKDSKVKPYLIFRPVDNVVDYKCRGNRIEYIILKWGEEERDGKKYTLYRVIDDQWDTIVEEPGGSISTDKLGVPQSGLKISTFYPRIENKLGYVPAIQISTYYDDVAVDEVKTSPISQLIPHLKTFMTMWAEHVITCILHSHPIYYQIGQKCRYEDKEKGCSCEDGILHYTINGEIREQTCPSCKGVGSSIQKDASTVLLLPQVDEEGKAYDVNNVAGYVAPPVEALNQQITELDWLKEAILMSGTGMTRTAELQIQKTATEAILNYKPLEKIISEILDNIEFVEGFLTDTIAKLYYSDYLRSEISYSRNLNLRDENTVLTEIESAKRAGASTSYVRTLHSELIQTRYQNNRIDLERNMLLERLEPFVGYTPSELTSSFGDFIDKETMIMKVYFSDYVVRFENEYGLITDYKENAHIKDRIKEIKAIIDGYNQEMMERLEEEEPEEPEGSEDVDSDEIADGDSEGTSDQT